jgi:hypothetical protein
MAAAAAAIVAAAAAACAARGVGAHGRRAAGGQGPAVAASEEAARGRPRVGVAAAAAEPATARGAGRAPRLVEKHGLVRHSPHRVHRAEPAPLFEVAAVARGARGHLAAALAAAQRRLRVAARSRVGAAARDATWRARVAALISRHTRPAVAAPRIPYETATARVGAACDARAAAAARDGDYLVSQHHCGAAAAAGARVCGRCAEPAAPDCDD